VRVDLVDLASPTTTLLTNKKNQRIKLKKEEDEIDIENILIQLLV
jgi:hypothetical protein